MQSTVESTRTLVTCKDCGEQIAQSEAHAIASYLVCALCAFTRNHYALQAMYAECGIGYEIPAEAVEQQARIDAYQASLPKLCYKCGGPARYAMCDNCASEVAREAARQYAASQILTSAICGHRVRSDANAHCGCMA